MRKIPKINSIVIKIGSSTITDDKSNINQQFISNLANVIHELKKKVPNVVIVSSGSVSVGFKSLGFVERPTDIIDKQACAAVGQTRLVWYYERELQQFGINTGQILITKDDFSNRRRYLNARYSIRRLLELGVVPIINENDSVVVDELKYIESFGDNDNLSALVAGLINADLLMILSDVDGLYNMNPLQHDDAVLMDEIKFINEDLLSMAGESVSGVGTGGMKSKIVAAKKAMDSGCYVGIINGQYPENIINFIEGEQVGTYFSHAEDPINRRKLWIAHAAIPKGDLILDKGAVNALVNHKKSLLPSGIQSSTGKFSIGDIVRIVDQDGAEIARGKIRYSIQDMKKIQGKKTSEIFDILGFKYSDEIVHRDDMVMSFLNGGIDDSGL